MLELNARNFLAVVQELRVIQTLTVQNVADQQSIVVGNDYDVIVDHVARLREALEAVGNRLALRALERLERALSSKPSGVNYATMSSALSDIESRFGDHLEDVKIFVMSEDDSSNFSFDAHDDVEISLNYTSASFDLEEAHKCIALERYTAAAFHAMRVLEIGVRALAKRLDIPDPVKAKDRNWGEMLKQIKSSLDTRFPVGRRLTGTEGAALESAYVTLDAVRNPWRNATMHVETLYAPHEVRHILECVKYFMRSLAKVCDEDGEDPI